MLGLGASPPSLVTRLGKKEQKGHWKRKGVVRKVSGRGSHEGDKDGREKLTLLVIENAERDEKKSIMNITQE